MKTVRHSVAYKLFQFTITLTLIKIFWIWLQFWTSLSFSFPLIYYMIMFTRFWKFIRPPYCRTGAVLLHLLLSLTPCGKTASPCRMAMASKCFFSVRLSLNGAVTSMALKQLVYSKKSFQTSFVSTHQRDSQIRLKPQRTLMNRGTNNER